MKISPTSSNCILGILLKVTPHSAGFYNNKMFQSVDDDMQTSSRGNNEGWRERDGERGRDGSTIGIQQTISIDSEPSDL